MFANLRVALALVALIGCGGGHAAAANVTASLTAALIQDAPFNATTCLLDEFANNLSIEFNRISIGTKNRTLYRCNIDTAVIASIQSKSAFKVACNDGGALRGSACPVVRALGQGPTSQHMCVNAVSVTANGPTLLKCAGLNSDKQLGTASGPTNELVAMVGPLHENVRSFCTGTDFSCAITKNLTVACVGRNDLGQIGQGDNSDFEYLTLVLVKSVTGVDLLENIVGLSCGSQHACAINSSGTWFCWGRNERGQLGNNSTTNSFLPTIVRIDGDATNDKQIVQISNGYLFSCGLAASGTVWCTGENSFGQLSIGSSSSRPKLVPVKSLTSSGDPVKANSISAGGRHFCLTTKAESGLLCVGSNIDGQLGCNDNRNRAFLSAPVGEFAALLSNGVKIMTGGADHTCLSPKSGGVLCSGSGLFGQLGRGEFNSSIVFNYVSNLGLGVEILDIAAGSDHTAVLFNNGTVQTFGRNNHGVLALGDFDFRNIPTSIRNLTASSAVSRCGATFYALSRNGDPCDCSSAIGVATFRPDSGDANWGGVDGPTCRATSQTIEISFDFVPSTVTSALTTSVSTTTAAIVTSSTTPTAMIPTSSPTPTMTALPTTTINVAIAKASSSMTLYSRYCCIALVVATLLQR